MQQELYRYYKPETRGLDQEGLLEDLSKGLPGRRGAPACLRTQPHRCLHHPHLLTALSSSPGQCCRQA